MVQQARVLCLVVGVPVVHTVEPVVVVVAVVPAAQLGRVPLHVPLNRDVEGVPA
jgi:hypothetical protein